MCKGRQDASKPSRTAAAAVVSPRRVVWKEAQPPRLACRRPIVRPKLKATSSVQIKEKKNYPYDMILREKSNTRGGGFGTNHLQSNFSSEANPLATNKHMIL